MGKNTAGRKTGVSVFPSVSAGKVSPDTGFDTAKLEEFDRVVDVTEQLSPDYDYEKLKENYKDTLLGNYIEENGKAAAGCGHKKALEYGVNALLGYKICR